MKPILSSLLLLSILMVQAVRADDEISASGKALSPNDKPSDVMELPPGEFFNQDLSVYSPSKKLQKLRNIPSAVYVLTADDIRRSGADTLVDVFRLIPGIEVARVSSHEWAITARGFNQVYGNKILLLIDGAPVETPLFNGVLWENINIPLDLIERIEVVRGPGAAVWGTRAMNGLINVITKDAFTLPHNRAQVGVGNEHLFSGTAETGKVFSENAAVQAYAKIDRYDSSASPGGKRLDDNWDILSTNVRADLKPTDNDKVRFTTGFSDRQADIELGVPSLTPPFSDDEHGQRQNNRASLGVLWDHTMEKDSTVSVEWTNMLEKRDDFLLDLNSYYTELEVRHRFKPLQGNDLTYGVNGRFYIDDTSGSDTLHFDPPQRSLEYYRSFVNDEITLMPQLLTLTLGSRFEQNEQAGFSALPSARLLWSPLEHLSLWTGVSYTTGNPSRVYDDVRLNVQAFQEPASGLPAIVQLIGQRHLDAEKLTAYEVGAWAEPVERFYTSATAFYFHYRDIQASTIGDPTVNSDDPNNPFLLVPAQYSGVKVNSVGAEFTADWNVNDWYGVAGTYSNFQIMADNQDTNAQSLEDNPKNTYTLRNHFSFKPIEVDAILRSVETNDLAASVLHSYVEGDLRIAWLVKQNLELELLGRNLLHNRHQEIDALIFQTPTSAVERSVFFRTTYTF